MCIRDSQRPDYRSNALCASPRRRFGIRSLQDLPVGDVMKRIAAFLLLVALSVAGSIPARAQRTSDDESARLSRSAKTQQKMLKKANKKQRNAMKKYEKAQRKAA